MNGYAFYAEMPDQEAKSKRGFTRKALKAMAERGEHCNVTAILTQYRYGNRLIDAVSAAYYHANSQVTTTSVDRDWLRDKTVHIDEATARKLHPLLFQLLDYEPA